MPSFAASAAVLRRTSLMAARKGSWFSSRQKSKHLTRVVPKALAAATERSRAIGFEEWAGDVRDLKGRLLQESLRFGNFFFIQIDDVLVPHAAELDEGQ